MILSIRITRQQKQALLTIYPSVKYLIEKTIKDIADKIITEGEQSDIEKDIKEYHDRQVLNDYDIRGRKMTQATKNKISKALKGKYLGSHTLPETREAISKANIGKHFIKHSEETKRKMSLAHKGRKYKKFDDVKQLEN